MTLASWTAMNADELIRTTVGKVLADRRTEVTAAQLRSEGSAR